MLRSNFKLAEKVNANLIELEEIRDNIAGGPWYLRWAKNGDIILTKNIIVDGETIKYEDLPFIQNKVTAFTGNLQTGIATKITAANAEFAAIQ